MSVMRPVSNFAIDSVKRGWNLVRGNNVKRLDKIIAKNEARIKRHADSAKFSEKLDKNELLNALYPDLKAKVDKRTKSLSSMQDRLQRRRNWEENKSNVARMGLLGASVHGTVSGLMSGGESRNIAPEYATGGQFAKIAGNIPADTSRPTSSDPLDAPDYYDFQEFVNMEGATPDRKSLPVMNKREEENSPLKIAHMLGVDLYTVNVIEEELGLRERMPAEKLAGVNVDLSKIDPYVRDLKRAGSTLLGLSIIGAAINKGNQAAMEYGMTPSELDLKPPYAE